MAVDGALGVGSREILSPWAFALSRGRLRSIAWGLQLGITFVLRKSSNPMTFWPKQVHLTLNGHNFSKVGFRTLRCCFLLGRALTLALGKACKVTLLKKRWSAYSFALPSPKFPAILFLQGGLCLKSLVLLPWSRVSSFCPDFSCKSTDPGISPDSYRDKLAFFFLPQITVSKSHACFHVVNIHILKII